MCTCRISSRLSRKSSFHFAVFQINPSLKLENPKNIERVLSHIILPFSDECHPSRWMLLCALCEPSGFFLCWLTSWANITNVREWDEQRREMQIKSERHRRLCDFSSSLFAPFCYMWTTYFHHFNHQSLSLSLFKSISHSHFLHAPRHPQHKCGAQLQRLSL